MSSLAVPALEAAAAALARVLGLIAAAGASGAVVNEAAKKRVESADKAKAVPIAEAGSQAKRDTCTKCPPDCGQLVERNWNMSEVSRAYQARITGFAPYTEWEFIRDFDGFQSAGCLLLEAKGLYDQFFDDEGKPKWFFALSGATKIRRQAEAQQNVVLDNPTSRLHWHFMQPKSYRYFSSLFEERIFQLQCYLTP